ncbi:MAG TPA: alpha/beta hydrolase [Lacisediminihabitans sp.]|jgi:pimeloyl-ACP methyl ester carboxylesterase|nr:alpha/beta hydrolase [Lacisediminihabitans sp.]HXD62764.1 alpha/beta hydrolase [Lacisediminihabitans sp.]
MIVESPFAALLADIPVERHEVSVLGSTTRYWVYGDPHAATTVVVSHGYRGEHHGLEPVIAQLPGVRWISPDLPGFGESTPLVDVPHSIEGYARWLIAFFEALGLTGTAVALGHSFGSIISSQAIALGLQTPRLILINPIAISGLEGPKPLATKLTVLYYRLAGRLPERVGSFLLKRWLIVHFMSVTLAKTKDKALRRWIHAEHHNYFNRFASRDVVVEAFEASISADVSDFAAAIDVPTLLVAAELDDITPVSAQYDLEKLFPHASLTVLDGVGHLIHYEVPARAAAAIREFLTEPSDT